MSGGEHRGIRAFRVSFGRFEQIKCVSHEFRSEERRGRRCDSRPLAAVFKLGENPAFSLPSARRAIDQRSFVRPRCTTLTAVYNFAALVDAARKPCSIERTMGEKSHVLGGGRSYHWSACFDRLCGEGRLRLLSGRVYYHCKCGAANKPLSVLDMRAIGEGRERLPDAVFAVFLKPSL